MNAASESPIIALVSDFGTRDYFVGAMKGVILTINRNANVIDITHDIEPQNIASAGFTLRACYGEFPPQTIFVAVVDPGVGSDRRAILVETEKYYFLAPDNGLLGFVFDETENYCVYALTEETYFRRPVSRTFHGRDVFAACAAHLSKGVAPMSTATESTAATAGLRGVVAAQSAIGDVNGEQGILIYQGYNIHDLAEHSTFEEVVFLLWNGALPKKDELEDLKSAISGQLRSSGGSHRNDENVSERRRPDGRSPHGGFGARFLR
jgi:hypothetical protein